MRSFWGPWRRRLGGLARMSQPDRLLAMESLCMLAAARLFVHTDRGNRLISRLGGTPTGPAQSANAQPVPTTDRYARLGAMLDRTARITWWRSLCLEQALAGKWMLRRRGIASTIYLGIAKDGGHFAAHAWLVGEGEIVTGAGTKTYATLAAFGEIPGPRTETQAEPALKR
jgi:hypothetical protein